jgi:hypothetical protein
VFEETIRGVYSHRKRLGDQLCRVRTKYMQLFEDMLHEVSVVCMRRHITASGATLYDIAVEAATCSVLPCSSVAQCSLHAILDGAMLTTVQRLQMLQFYVY